MFIHGQWLANSAKEAFKEKCNIFYIRIPGWEVWVRVELKKWMMMIENACRLVTWAGRGLAPGPGGDNTLGGSGPRSGMWRGPGLQQEENIVWVTHGIIMPPSLWLIVLFVISRVLLCKTHRVSKEIILFQCRRVQRIHSTNPKRRWDADQKYYLKFKLDTAPTNSFD